MQDLTCRLLGGSEAATEHIPHRLFLATIVIEQNKPQVAMQVCHICAVIYCYVLQLLQETQTVFPTAQNVCTQVSTYLF